MKTYLITYRFKGHCGRCGAERFVVKHHTVKAEHPQIALNKAEGMHFDPDHALSVDPLEDSPPVLITIEEKE